MIVNDRQNGFTLIEILVVMVIISIISSVALLSIAQNQKKEIEKTAHMLASSIALAEEEAILRPATFALSLSKGSYQFFVAKNDNDHSWQPLSERVFKKHIIPSSVQISLKIHDEIIPLDGKPHIIFSQSGDITPFIIFIGKEGESPLFQIIGNNSGEVKSDSLA